MIRSRLRSALVLWVVIASLRTASAGAHTFTEEEFRCPLDGTRFTSLVDASGTIQGQRLDFMPLGETAAPYRLAVCPKCHFVVFTETLEPAEEKVLRPYIRSREYRRMARTGSPYFLFAKISEQLGWHPWSTAYLYLQASWEVEEKKPTLYPSYLRLARDSAIHALETGIETIDDRRGAQFLIGEIDRRLGEFERAEAHFRGLAESWTAPEEEPWRQLIAYERKLIAARDSGPYEAPVVPVSFE